MTQQTEFDCPTRDGYTVLDFACTLNELSVLVTGGLVINFHCLKSSVLSDFQLTASFVDFRKVTSFSKRYEIYVGFSNM